MKLALAQIDPTVGDLDGNRELILARIEEARTAGADLVVLPELAVTGYPPEDLLLRAGFVHAARDSLERIAAETRASSRSSACHCSTTVPLQRLRDLRGRRGRRLGEEAAPAELRRLRREAVLRLR